MAMHSDTATWAGVLENTVKPVLRDYCQERLPVLKDHILLAESLHFNATEPVTTKTTCLERPYFYGQWGGLSREVLLYLSLSFDLSHQSEQYDGLRI